MKLGDENSPNLLKANFRIIGWILKLIYERNRVNGKINLKQKTKKPVKGKAGISLVVDIVVTVIT